MLIFFSIKKRAFVKDENKEIISNLVPKDLSEDIVGSLLGDGTLRYKGKNALLGIQQVHPEITEYLWKNCFEANLIKSNIFCAYAILIEKIKKQYIVFKL